jgi:ribonuclease E
MTRQPTEAELKYERRDAQRAALDERERLRALFESAKPLDGVLEGEAAEAPGAIEPTESVEPAAPKGRGRGRGKSADRAPKVARDLAPQVVSEPVLQVDTEPSPRFQAFEAPVFVPVPEVRVQQSAPVEPEPTPILFTPDLVAEMLTPSPRPRLMGGAAKETPVPEAAPSAPVTPKRGRPRNKALAEILDAPVAPKRSPRAKAVKAVKAVKAQKDATETAPLPVAPSKSRKK